jgi:hypothetical protein
MPLFVNVFPFYTGKISYIPGILIGNIKVEINWVGNSLIIDKFIIR